MHYGAHFGFVNAHAKSIGRNNNTRIAIFPTSLPFVFGFVFEAGMKMLCCYAILNQKLSHFFGFFPVAHIYYRGAGHIMKYFQQVFVLVFGSAHHVSQIGTRETFLKKVFFAEMQFFLNIVHHFGCGSSREGQHRNIGQYFTNIGNAQVRRPKIVAPLRDAMRFINRYHTNASLTDFF